MKKNEKKIDILRNNSLLSHRIHYILSVLELWKHKCNVALSKICREIEVFEWVLLIPLVVLYCAYTPFLLVYMTNIIGGGVFTMMTLVLAIVSWQVYLNHKNEQRWRIAQEQNNKGWITNKKRQKEIIEIMKAEKEIAKTKRI